MVLARRVPPATPRPVTRWVPTLLRARAPLKALFAAINEGYPRAWVPDVTIRLSLTPYFPRAATCGIEKRAQAVPGE